MHDYWYIKNKIKAWELSIIALHFVLKKDVVTGITLFMGVTKVSFGFTTVKPSTTN